MHRAWTLLGLLALTGCGAEVAGTAATAAASKAEEARAAEQMKDEVVERYRQALDAAQQLQQHKLEEAQRGN